jgi:purine-binding chemotaxis protein CheW
VTEPARDAAERPDAAPPARHVVFRAGGERFALPLEAVREVVVPQPPFARVPRAPPGVEGAMNLRGRVVAVVELAALLGLPRDALGPGQGHVLVIDRARGMGVLVASVVGVEALAPTRPGSFEAGRLDRGVAEVHGAAVTVLDAEVLEARAAGLFQPT